MKKLISIAVMVFITMMTACMQPVTKDKAAIIKPSEFSEETQKALELFDDDMMFFDYTVDETIKSFTISVWSYEDGEWMNKGDSLGNIDTVDNQIAFRFNDTGYELFTIDKNGHVKFSAPDVYTGFSDTMQQTSTCLSNPTDIVLNTEIPLWVKIGNNKDGISISDNFRNSDCTAGIAVTVVFSDKVLE